MKANRLVLLAVSCVSALVLTGCSQSGDVAARVGGKTVPTSDVDFLTKVQCRILDDAANKGEGQVQAVPASTIRIEWVNTLVETELSRQLAARENLSYDRETLRSAMDQFEPTLSRAPAADRDRTRQLIEEIYRGQLEVVGLAQQKLADAGVDNPSDEQVRAEVTKILTAFRKDVGVDVNPQYGPDADGVAGSVDASLSRAVSSFAKHAVAAQSTSSQPDTAWVNQLPANQRCG